MLADAKPALVWEGRDGRNCPILAISQEGRATVGACDGTVNHHRLDEGQFAYGDLWQAWLHRFSPFRVETASGQVLFEGQGKQSASAAWQRAVAAWAKLAYMELESGRSAASWGTALSWSLPAPGSPGYCQHLQVEGYRRASASLARCQGEVVQDFGQVWLETSEIEALNDWFYSKAPVFVEGVRFFVTGTQPMTQHEKEELLRCVQALFSRLTAAR
ncbi:MAG: hypothetical protein L0387_12955 [Acidobacteria bacterium]|nr:hypothetical protein [Acidobacteriota bacterium]MCI0724335.1 hypothetical protein [Acidobacteriota bacterium]